MYSLKTPTMWLLFPTMEKSWISVFFNFQDEEGVFVYIKIIFLFFLNKKNLQLPLFWKNHLLKSLGIVTTMYMCTWILKGKKNVFSVLFSWVKRMKKTAASFAKTTFQRMHKSKSFVREKKFMKIIHTYLEFGFSTIV